MKYAYQINFMDSASRDASGYSEWIKVNEAEKITIYTQATAKSGTNPTLDLVVETSPDKSEGAVDAYPLETFTQFTDVGKQSKYTEYPGRWMRIKYSIGGTDTPTFTFKVLGIGKGETRGQGRP